MIDYKSTFSKKKLTENTLRYLFSTLVLFAILLPSLACAGITTIDKTNTFGVGVGFGFNVLTGDLVKDAFKSGGGLGSCVSYNFNGYFGVFTSFYHQRPKPTELLKSEYGGGRMRIYSLSFGPRISFAVAGEINPAVDLFFAYHQVRFSGSIGEYNSTLYSIGGRFGVEFFMGKKFSVTPTVGYHYLLNELDVGPLYFPPTENRKGGFAPLSVEVLFYI